MKLKNLAVVGLLAAGSVEASVISYTGVFDNDETRFYTTFGVSTDSQVTLSSLGYAGGVNGAGETILDGGFDSQLFIFDSAGALLEHDDDDGSIVSASSNKSWDAYISRYLTAGTYTAVLTQYNSDYISGDLITGNWSVSGVNNFLDVSGSQRTNAYAFDISGDYLTDVNGFDTDPVSVSEPATFALLGLGLAGFGFARRQKQS
ncbi:DVUA0089 family protein [Alkalimarinus sediminis]|uniref:DVUA0089 family protein n=1 Tax=Alkalimarinus sediminis TaxID=1632866 RepID=A0A9E8HT99_9ALTE|nr:DVUA0089 family protein [Alkalimarinus sediminis]UZW75344.1 DVUA0089 family protein [Alkalimarinus sediminis]